VKKQVEDKNTVNNS